MCNIYTNTGHDFLNTVSINIHMFHNFIHPIYMCSILSTHTNNTSNSIFINVLRWRQSEWLDHFTCSIEVYEWVCNRS